MPRDAAGGQSAKCGKLSWRERDGHLFLSGVNRDLCERGLADNVERICFDAARHDDRRLMDGLLELGFINAENIHSLIELVGSLRDAAMTNHLLEMRRVRFGCDDDFEL